MRDVAQAPKPPEAGPGTLQAIAVMLFVVNAVLVGLEKYARGRVEIAGLIGAVLAPIIFAIVLVWIVRLFKRATSPRGAAKMVVGTLAVFAIGSCGGLLSAASATGKASGSSDEPKSAAQRAELTAASAANIHDKQIDSVTWLKHVKATGDTVVYAYAMSGINANELDPASANAFRRQLIQKACGDAELRDRLLSHGVVVRYQYYDWMGRTITAVDVTEDVCSESGSGARA